LYGGNKLASAADLRPDEIRSIFFSLSVLLLEEMTTILTKSAYLQQQVAEDDINLPPYPSGAVIKVV
jgi:hypothetical protein